MKFFKESFTIFLIVMVSSLITNTLSLVSLVHPDGYLQNNSKMQIAQMYAIEPSHQSIMNDETSDIVPLWPLSATVAPTLVSIYGPGEGSTGMAQTFQVEVLPENTTLPLTYTWQATDIAPISYTAGLTATHIFVWDEPGQKAITITAHNDAASVTNMATINITPIDITLGKAVSPQGDVASNGILHYTLTYTNPHAAIIRGAVITDAIPTHTTFLQAENGGVSAGNIVSWTLPDIAAQDSGIVQFSVRADEGLTLGMTITNVAYFDAPATNLTISNETANPIALMPNFNLTRKYATGSTVVAPGDSIMYTIAYTNSGSDTGYGVTISDPLPDYVSYVSGGTYAGNQVTFDIGTVAVGGHDEVTFTVQVNADVQSGSRIENRATIASNQTSPIQTNQVNHTISGPVLELYKEVSPISPVMPGDLLTYTLTYSNAGTSTATGMMIEDTVPPGTRYHAGTHTGNNTTLHWDIGTLTAGAHGQRTFSLQALGGVVNVTNYAVVQSDQQPAWKTSNTVTSTVETVAVEVYKSANPVAEVPSGGQITYTLTYKNTSEQTATGVMILDTLPTGTTHQSGGTYDSASRTVSYDLGTVVPNQTGVLNFTVQVDAPANATLTNTAAVSFSPYYSSVYTTSDPLDINGTQNFMPVGDSTSQRQYVAQSFIATAPLLDRVGVFIFGNETPYPEFSIQLWGDDQGDPDGSTVLLGSGTLATSASGQRYFAQATAPLSLTVGQRYWIAIEFDINGAGSAGVRYANDNVYPQGTWRYSDDGSTTWKVPGPGETTDMNVRIEYIAPPRSNIVAHAVVTAPLCLAVAPTTLRFSAVLSGTNPTPKAFQINNCAVGHVEWTASKTQPWLEMSPASGVAPSSLIITPHIQGLALGTYVDTITIYGEANTQNSPQTLHVNISIGTGAIYLPLVTRNWPPFPGKPTLNAIAAPGANSSYNIVWGATSLAESYTLERATTNTFSDAIVVYNGTATAQTIVSEGIALYYYRVKAHNQFGDSGWSNVQSVAVFWEQEPNDERQTEANGPLASGVTYYGKLSQEDVFKDYFFIDISTSHLTSISLTNIPAGSDYDLALYNAGGDRIKLSEQGSNADENITNNLTPGRYYIQVIRSGGGSDAPYYLQAVFE